MRSSWTCHQTRTEIQRGITSLLITADWGGLPVRRVYGLPHLRNDSMTRISACRSNWVYKRQMKTSNATQSLLFLLITMFSNFASATPYATTTQLAVSFASLVLVYGLYKLLAFVFNELTSPLRYVPGPPSASFIYGNFKQLSESVSRKPHCFLVNFGWLLKRTIRNRIIPRCRRIGSTNTDRQSNSKMYSE